MGAVILTGKLTRTQSQLRSNLSRKLYDDNQCELITLNNKMNANTSIYDHIRQMQYPLPTNAPPGSVTRNERQHQISIDSTYDADLVLRKVIEDRSSILALKQRAAENGVELMKAK
mmetsp:Transcript_2552/g.3809  ORF Transcript_2552/g.3809 Transcript_2552/m.3809 type:complete len:116 (-) Transcript_2552:801-1148(-)